MPPPQETSPDGTIRVEFDVSTGLMSHEIYSPRILALPGGEVLADLWGTQWDASVQFDETGMMLMYLRHYPGDRPGFAVTIDARARSFWFRENPGERYALDEFVNLIGQRHDAQGVYPPRPPIPQRSRIGLILIWLTVAGILLFVFYVYTLL
jgi:hypothetical protein